MTGPLLIVNADDFGLTPGVCQAILRAGACGIVTSTSALANGPALTDAASSLRDSGLGVGAHLALVGSPGSGARGPRGADARRPPRTVGIGMAAVSPSVRARPRSIPPTCAASSPRRWKCSARTDSPSPTSTRTRTFTSGRASRASTIDLARDERRSGDPRDAVSGPIADRARRPLLLGAPRVARAQGERAVPGRHCRVRRDGPTRPRSSTQRRRAVRDAPRVECRARVSSR